MRPRRGHATLVFAAALWVGQGAADAAGDVDYVRDVRPILKQRCYACHGALKQKSGLRLDSAQAVRAGGKDGPAVVPGKPDESPLLDRVTENDASLRMPPEGAPLTPEQVARLRGWIEAGAPAPVDDRPEEDPARHWAFVKPVRPEVPEVRDPSWVRNPVDAFVAAEHDRRGLVPAPPADPASLLRRVYLDLIGLPPTRAELHEFLADPSERAYERVVDRLLASPAYGERWARHWMDVWRYSDWYGRRAVPDVTNSYAMLWRWRDWIVRSLNADRGYDRMVSLMLAADELTPADDAEVVANGFVLRNFYRWNYNTWMKDSVEHTAKAFLGLTLQCAHCHDHKYDPLTQADYFAFRAFFEPLEVRHDRVPGEADPGPYPKYVYGSSYKPITTGMARVVDEKLDAKTFLYLKGESRNVVPDRPPIEPSVPAFLRPDGFRVAAVELPAETYYPGLKAFVQQEERRKVAADRTAAETALATAQEVEAKALRAWWSKVGPPVFGGMDGVLTFVRLGVEPDEVRQARGNREAAERLAVAAARRSEALEARIAADLVKYGRKPGDAASLARAAFRAERVAEEATASAEAFAAGQAVEAAKDKAAADPKQAAGVTKTQAALDAATKKAAAAREALVKESDAYTPLSPVYPSRSTGRRSALAGWIASRDNPLTARVAVNHLWRWHFQTPLVATTHDFGRNGKPPTNPPLLDWLAVELMEPSTPGAAPWSMKSLHRLIVTSAAYRMASQAGPHENGDRAIDPENVALWKFPASRMEAEVVRDSLLHVAGALDRTVGGADIDLDQGLTSTRRSLYFTHHGEARMPFLELYDAPDACDAYVRTVSVVPQQALALTNNTLARSVAGRLAASLWDERTEGFVEDAFEQVIGRAPRPAERAASLAFLEGQTALLSSSTPPDPEAALHARVDLVHALFSHNDFVTIH